jgi:deoxyribodipyrimidine photo-lyase
VHEFGGPAYPPPIVDARAAVAAAKAQLYGLRQTQPAQDEASAIQRKHGSRRSGLPPSGVRARSPRRDRDPDHVREAEPPGDDAQGQLF